MAHSTEFTHTCQMHKRHQTSCSSSLKIFGKDGVQKTILMIPFQDASNTSTTQTLSTTDLAPTGAGHLQY